MSAAEQPARDNVVQVILSGARRHAARDQANIPGLGDAYSDYEIPSLSNHVTARFGAAASQLCAAKIARLRKEN